MPKMLPWLLWGGTNYYNNLVAPPADGTQLIPPLQLTRIAYGRPDTWKFIFSAQVTAAVPVDPGDLSGRLLIDFDVTVGVGRSQVTLLSFEEYSVNLALGIPSHQFWSSEVVSPARIDGTATSTGRCEQIVAQDIQCVASVRTSGVGTGYTGISLSVSAYFSPLVHVRPEWYQLREPEAQFPGAENKGS